MIIHRGVAELTGQRCKILSEAESVSQWSPPPQFAYSLAERGESGALGNRRLAKCVGRREKWTEGGETERKRRDEGHYVRTKEREGVNKVS